MSFLITRLFSALEHKPSVGYVASGAFAGVSVVGGKMAEVMPPNQLEQIPHFIQWMGYVTVGASCVGAILTAVIQVYRVRREAREESSRHPFERKHHHRPD